MASCITTKWGDDWSPQVRLTVDVVDIDELTSCLNWTLQYITDPRYPVEGSQIEKEYTVKINGKVVKNSTFIIAYKAGTYTIASGWEYIDKTTSKQTISFSISFFFGVTWHGVYSGTRSASGSVSIPAKTSYKVSYNANGGSGAPSDQTKWYGTNLTLSSTKPTRTGYTFLGWSTSSTGGVSYYNGGTYKSNSNITLYAVWSKNTYTVKYDANGGSGAPAAQTKYYNENLTLSSTKPTRSGYNFLGWATSSGGSVAYNPGGTYSTNAAITLYAKWAIGYAKPRITNFSVVRCNSSGNVDISGKYAKVNFTWATDKTPTTIAIYWKSTSASSWDNYAVAATSNNTATVNQIVGGGNLGVDTTYSFYVYVADSGGNTSSNTLTLSGGAYSIDILRGGNGVAFGKTAENAGYMDVNYNAHFRKDSKIDASLYMKGTNSSSAINSTNKLVFQDISGNTKQTLISGPTGLWISDSLSSVSNGAGMDFAYLMWKPLTDDKLYLGGANFKWKAVYAINGTIQTSDRNAKENIKPIDSKYELLFSKLKPVTYKLKDTENDTHDRIHTGYISQDIEESMAECGLTSLDFAGFCKDIKREATDGNDILVDVLDENGEPVYEYSLRYEEFIALNTHMIQKQQKEINDLKSEVAELKNLVQQLLNK